MAQLFLGVIAFFVIGIILNLEKKLSKIEERLNEIEENIITEVHDYGIEKSSEYDPSGEAAI